MSLFGASAATTAASTAAQQAQGDTSQDIPLQSPPEDSISDISFSPQSEHLAVASWDKKVRIYEIAPDGSSAGKAMYDHEGPVLSVHWSKVMCTNVLLKQPPLIRPANTHKPV
jgi:mRNA export factor